MQTPSDCVPNRTPNPGPNAVPKSACKPNACPEAWGGCNTCVPKAGMANWFGPQVDEISEHLRVPLEGRNGQGRVLMYFLCRPAFRVSDGNAVQSGHHCRSVCSGAAWVETSIAWGWGWEWGSGYYLVARTLCISQPVADLTHPCAFSHVPGSIMRPCHGTR